MGCNGQRRDIQANSYFNTHQQASVCVLIYIVIAYLFVLFMHSFAVYLLYYHSCLLFINECIALIVCLLVWLVHAVLQTQTHLILCLLSFHLITTPKLENKRNNIIFDCVLLLVLSVALYCCCYNFEFSFAFCVPMRWEKDTLRHKQN